MKILKIGSVLAINNSEMIRDRQFEKSHNFEKLTFKFTRFYMYIIFKCTPENFYNGSKHNEPRSQCSPSEQPDLGPYCL